MILKVTSPKDGMLTPQETWKTFAVTVNACIVSCVNGKKKKNHQSGIGKYVEEGRHGSQSFSRPPQHLLHIITLPLGASFKKHNKKHNSETLRLVWMDVKYHSMF